MTERPVSAVVFLGPTLPVERARKCLDAVYLPPAAQGDVVRALALQPAAIVLIDGYFSSQPAVWHKELLLAMARGVHVFGASSMGALRAAELHRFGMIGVGQVFDWFRTGALEDDDEVAIVHGPASTGFGANSEAMVDIRHALQLAVEAGVVPEATATRLVAAAKALHYPERSFPRLLSQAREAGGDPTVVDDLHAYLPQTRPGVKERDALAVLRAVSAHIDSAPPPLQVPWTLEHTVFLEAVKTEVALTATAGVGRDADQEGDSVEPDAFTLDRHRVLLRLLARREAQAQGLDVSDRELREAVTALRRRLGLLRAEETRRWLKSSGLTLADLRTMARDEVLIGKLTRLHHDDIAAALPHELRARSQTRHAGGEFGWT